MKGVQLAMPGSASHNGNSIQYYQPYTGTAVLHVHFSIDPDPRTTELMIKDDDNECSH